MAKLKLHLSCFLLILPVFLYAQPSDDWIKSNFIVEVHVIDDFIDRFNGEVDQRVLDKWYQLFQKRDISRKEIIYSLFNLRSTDWSEAEVEDFINQIVDEENPFFLDFESDQWYATLNCDMGFQGLTYQTNLVLKIRKDQATGGLEWVIVSMLNPEIFADFCTEPFPYVKATRKAFLSPMSHGTNFSGLKRIFEDRTDLVDCMDFDPNNRILNTLAWEVYLGTLTLEKINSVDFHFFQVPNWVFVVKQVAREDFNTGWLVSELYRVDEMDMMNYKTECLNLVEPGE